jgi:uncharacterized Zn finger protein
MKLLHFEEYFDDLILKRGKNYFDQGHIKKIDAKANNRYIVEVAGTVDYKVEIFVSTDTEEIVDSFCDCPYDRGNYCNHQAAVIFTLRRELALESEKKETSY